MKTVVAFVKFPVVVLAGFVVSVGLAQSSAAQNTSLTQPPVTSSDSAKPSASAVFNRNYEPLIGVGDLLKVSVLSAPDYDQELRVDGEGDVVLALVGAVHIAGLTTEQAQQTIRKRLVDGAYFADPQVAVFEKEYATQGVSVLGEVQKPGVYPLTGPRRLFDVLSLASGTTPEKNIDADVEILPGDTVVVTKAGVVYVVGAVKTSTGIILENSNGITVLQAVATAGGMAPNASLNGAKIIRKGPNGPLEVPISLKKIMAAKSPDVKLQPEDILFVPTSAGKTAAGMALESGVRLATSVAAYAVFY
jgi:polysaccharide export outer membrane protein